MVIVKFPIGTLCSEYFMRARLKNQAQLNEQINTNLCNMYLTLECRDQNNGSQRYPLLYICWAFDSNAVYWLRSSRARSLYNGNL